MPAPGRLEFDGGRSCEELATDTSPLRTLHPLNARLVKDFEREARIDGLPPKELAERKRSLVTQLNNYIAMKKSYAVTLEDREELFGADEKGKGKGPLKVDRGIEGKRPWRAGRRLQLLLLPAPHDTPSSPAPLALLPLVPIAPPRPLLRAGQV